MKNLDRSHLIYNTTDNTVTQMHVLACWPSGTARYSQCVLSDADRYFRSQCLFTYNYKGSGCIQAQSCGVGRNAPPGATHLSDLNIHDPHCCQEASLGL